MILYVWVFFPRSIIFGWNCKIKNSFCLFCDNICYAVPFFIQFFFKFFISYSMMLWATLTMTFVIWDLVSTNFTFVDVFLTIDPAESSIRKPNTMSIMSRVKSFHFYILLWPLINNTLQKALIMHRYGQMGIGCEHQNTTTTSMRL